MKDILFLDVVLKERIWGGSDLAPFYHDKSTKKIGEAWILSGHFDGTSKIINGDFKGLSLSELYLKEKVLFGGHNNDRFPLLIKILDAVDDLSVQVHPDDKYALKHHNDLGKNECWYILEAKKDAKIIYGHNAKNKEEFNKLVKANKWNQLLNYQPVKKGQFYNIPVGTVHAIGSGIQILEIQQSSNTTYRIYDYDRIEDNGKKRDLHIDRAVEVINYGDDLKSNKIETYKTIKRLVSNKYFTVDKVTKTKHLEVKNDKYTIIIAVDGNLTIKINDSEFVLENLKAAIITNNVNQFSLNVSGEAFIVKEEEINLTEMYKI